MLYKESNVGLNFAYDDEAELFHNTMISKYLSKVKKSSRSSEVSNRDSTISKSTQNHRDTVQQKSILRNHTKIQAIPEERELSAVPALAEGIKYGMTRKSKKKIDKSLIGKPDNFRVVQQIRLNDDYFEVK